MGLRRTKIIGTLGPASCSSERISQLVEAGMDGARLNFSHGTHEDYARYARLFREVGERVGRPLALIGDLQGPKLRVGTLAGPVELVAEEEIIVVDNGQGEPRELPVMPPVLTEALRPGHEILIDDGAVRLRVEDVSKGRARCCVLVGGTVSTNKGVNLSGVNFQMPSLTEKDLHDLSFALEIGVDFIALSFVHSAADILDLREKINAADSESLIISKIERAEAVEELEAIISKSDAVMVARGDLGAEIGPPAVPMTQKRIIRESLEHEKPTITATQMLESMINHPDPTRAEVSDVANAILDGTSAIMLSAETAIGKFPVEAVATADRIACAVEPSLEYRYGQAKATDRPFLTVREAMSNASCDIAEVLDAAALIVPTFTGRTASAVARHRPMRPVVAVTHRKHAAQQLAIEWGVVPIRIEESIDTDDLWNRSLAAAREAGIVEEGDRVVITGGSTVNISGSTNLIRVETA